MKRKYIVNLNTCIIVIISSYVHMQFPHSMCTVYTNTLAHTPPNAFASCILLEVKATKQKQKRKTAHTNNSSSFFPLRFRSKKNYIFSNVLFLLFAAHWSCFSMSYSDLCALNSYRFFQNCFFFSFASFRFKYQMHTFPSKQ